MKFRTECEIKKPFLHLSTERPIVGIGSCFAENIVAKLRQCMVRAVNPLGVLFNPLSIAEAIELCVLDHSSIEKFEASLFRSEDLWHSWLFDSNFSSLSREKSKEIFEKRSIEFRETFNQAQTILVTFGTSYCYFKSDDHQEVVANCHKQGSDKFVRIRISIDEIVARWSDLCTSIKKEKDELNIVFSVSPVRHVRDGLHENNLSKAILMLAIEELCQKFDYCHYFPAFELLNDDLRDYRFYAADLVHPSETAIDYIFEKFVDTYFDETARATLKQGHDIYRRLNHKPILKESAAFQRFTEETQRKYEEFIKNHPGCLRLEDFI